MKEALEDESLESIDAATKRYTAAAHAMQTGVALEMGRDTNNWADQEVSGTSSKQLRTGINSSFVSQAACAELLIEKGIFTLQEYTIAQADAMEKEVRR